MKLKNLIICLVAASFALVILILTIVFLNPKKHKEESFDVNKNKPSENKLILKECPVVGLINDKNVCYFNSILQALYSQRKFLGKLFEFKHNEDQKCIIILKEIFDQMLAGKIVNTSKYLEEIISAAGKSKNFIVGQLQDAFDCLGILISQILKELNGNPKTGVFPQKVFKKFHRQNFIVELFYNQGKETITCDFCPFKNAYIRNYYAFVFYFENSIQESIYNRLKTNYFDCFPGSLQNKYHQAKNIFEFIRLPQIFIIKNTRSDIYKKILIDNKMCVQNQNYTFKACIFYINSNHFFTVAVHNGILYEFNDVVVKKLNIESIEDIETHGMPDILIYEIL
ncbi:putative ubiquitin carboxyl-terminal hydrolase [Hamiltosporidium magnivora]|uniref:Putative ubiquitin carboxyl-terminal hydrolase n=1 Tax=Hamiltosporidium magnivora TaxID=148818 RepID=A0A4Q9L9G9_9MICR|nr:putative ubiquitin carboxyl-terminal hydrolase [Hamiltosporidium magnivora]